MLDTSVRLLRLLGLLQSRFEWTGPDLAERLQVSTRTVRTDIDRLRGMGYQVDSSTGPTGGYRLGAGTALPPLLLDDEEAAAVALSLRAAAGGSVTGIEEASLRALAKLEQTLPSRLRHRVDALRSVTVSAAARGPSVDPAALAEIAGAAHRSERLRFDYTDHHGQIARRIVEPHRLVYTGRRWYLLAWDLDRADWRTFRADRIDPKLPSGPRFSPRDMPDDQATDRVLRGVGSRAYRHPARVLLRAPAAVMADKISSIGGVLTAVDEATCVLETGGPTLAELGGYLGSLEVEFEVLEPVELREALRDLARRCERAAGG